MVLFRTNKFAFQFDRFEREGPVNPCYRQTCGHYHLSYLLAVSYWPARPGDQVAVLDARVQNGDPDFAVAYFAHFCAESQYKNISVITLLALSVENDGPNLVVMSDQCQLNTVVCSF